MPSQPLCFNIFGELQHDLATRTAIMSEMTSGRVLRVTGLAFEHSSGRGDASYTVEVKYHEDLKGTAAEHRGRYDEIASGMDCFGADATNALLLQPLQQI